MLLTVDLATKTALARHNSSVHLWCEMDMFHGLLAPSHAQTTGHNVRSLLLPLGRGQTLLLATDGSGGTQGSHPIFQSVVTLWHSRSEAAQVLPGPGT